MTVKIEPKQHCLPVDNTVDNRRVSMVTKQIQLKLIKDGLGEPKTRTAMYCWEILESLRMGMYHFLLLL